MRPDITDRYYRVFTYQNIDRVPDLEFGYWPQTIRRWLKEGLPLKMTPDETNNMFNAKLDAYFGFEPAGAEDETGIVARIYNATASGANQLHDYNPNVVSSKSRTDAQRAHLKWLFHTDPIVQARCERVEARGEDSFLGYTVPTAVLAFRQGFGRLIRSRTDRGVVLLTDRRLLSRQYGAAFLRSLPTGTRPATSLPRLVEAVRRFFAADATEKKVAAEKKRASGAREGGDE
jgi:hypothetical protein